MNRYRRLWPAIFGLTVLLLVVLVIRNWKSVPTENPKTSNGNDSAAFQSRGGVKASKHAMTPRLSGNKPQVGSASTNAPTADTYGPHINDPVRRNRHRQVLHYLQSPARDTPECAEIARLCQRYNLGPWAVPQAYNIAWELTHFPYPPGVPLDMHPAVIRVEWLLGTKPDRGLLESLRGIKPTVFFGQSLEVQTQIGDRMLDGLNWNEFERMSSQQPQQAR